MFKLLDQAAAFALERVVVTFLAVLVVLWAPLALAEEEFLPPAEAFQFSARMLDSRTIEVNYRIADGYYMYREQFSFRAQGAALGKPVIPTGMVKFDETFQKDVETYRDDIAITVPVEASGPFVLVSTSQGCSDKGLCYPPMESKANLSPQGSNPVEQAIGPGDGMAAVFDEMGRIEASLRDGKLLVILPLFLLLGLGLSLTPCVLPMVPILSSIILGEGVKVSRRRGFALSAAYSLGMAFVYTSLGVMAGLLGEGLAAALQSPWMLATFALLMALLSLSMFGVYELQVPSWIQARLAEISANRRAGRMAGVFGMGAVSALIVGPCVAAPLAGVLMYISQTRDVIIGGSALFALATGMSVPLLLVGVSAGAVLPRAGAWMESVKYFFGVLMLALALWIVVPVTPAWVPMLGWGILGMGYAAHLIFRRQGGRVAKGVGVVFAALGLVQIVGLTSGGRDPLLPLAHLTNEGAHETRFQRVRSVAELDAMVAGANGKTVMLDFYADWCVSCKEMEKLTFSDPRVQAEFSDMLLLQADVTANNEADKALLKRFRLFGPPGIIFFDKQGREIPGGRVIGYQNADKFLQALTLVKSF